MVGQPRHGEDEPYDASINANKATRKRVGKGLAVLHPSQVTNFIEPLLSTIGSRSPRLYDTRFPLTICVAHQALLPCP